MDLYSKILKGATMLALMAMMPTLEAAAQNIRGRITCDGVGVEGVVVSDGYVVTTTNADGRYEMTSEKKNGYVFYTIPKGYMPERKMTQDESYNIFLPFWETLERPVSSAETHNFRLRREDNTKHIMIVGADTHLANRTDDQNQFRKGFLKRLEEEKTAAGNTPIYSTILGDLTWDNYWYSENFNPSNFRSTMYQEKYPMAMFPVIGNHDNDGGTIPNENTDFNSSWMFRRYLSPNYYSYNLGNVHYVVLDDIFYKNEDTGGSYRKGIAGSRNYDKYINDYQLEWLKKDLAYVDKNTPIIVELHIPVWSINSSFNFSANLTNRGVNSTTALCDLLKDYKEVHILSGHTHYNYHAFPTAYPNIHENNVAAICATWWWTGYLTGRHICKDGTPGGYEVYYIDGDNIKWQYHSIEENGNAQFRVFDVNELRDYYNSSSTLKDIMAYDNTRMNYGTYTKNTLILNVFNYDPQWKVEASVGSRQLTVSRVTVEDALHTLAYDIPRYESAKAYTTDFKSNRTTHMFVVYCPDATSTVSIKVTDRFGNIYTQEVKRPYAYNIDMQDNNVADLVGIKKSIITETKVYLRGSNICIETLQPAKVQIVRLNGISKTVSIKAGYSEFGGNEKGMYIVKVGDVTKKFYIK